MPQVHGFATIAKGDLATPGSALDARISDSEVSLEFLLDGGLLRWRPGRIAGSVCPLVLLLLILLVFFQRLFAFFVEVILELGDSLAQSLVLISKAIVVDSLGRARGLIACRAILGSRRLRGLGVAGSDSAVIDREEEDRAQASPNGTRCKR